MRTDRTFHLFAIVALLLCVFAVCTAGVAPAVAEISAVPPGTSPAARTVVTYSWAAVLLVVLILTLLALLFWLLLRWSHRLDQASYLGDVYRESVEDFESKRLATVPTERWRAGEYHREITQDTDWIRENRRPDPPPGMWGTGPGWTPPGYVLPPPPTSATGSGEPRIRTDAEQKAEADYLRADSEWRDKLEREVNARYRRDIDATRARARERAKFATDVDLSALRGRGAEFVLEFTAVVVIIFAAIILGILGILASEQIGTLLAAIAGYVLGRATTRGRATTPPVPERQAAGGEAKKEERAALAQ